MFKEIRCSCISFTIPISPSSSHRFIVTHRLNRIISQRSLLRN
nr:MAG TPA: hypothetical protein [Bacteriophage sp.]